MTNFASFTLGYLQQLREKELLKSSLSILGPGGSTLFLYMGNSQISSLSFFLRCLATCKSYQFHRGVPETWGGQSQMLAHPGVQERGGLQDA